MWKTVELGKGQKIFIFKGRDCPIKEGGRGVIFLEEVDTPLHTLVDILKHTFIFRGSPLRG